MTSYSAFTASKFHWINVYLWVLMLWIWLNILVRAEHSNATAPSGSTAGLPVNMTILSEFEDFIGSNTDHFIHKTVFSNQTRMLFIAGIEGTGHHAYDAMLLPCYGQKFCVGTANLSDTLFDYRDATEKEKEGTFGLWGSAELSRSDELFAIAFEQMRTLKQQMDTLNSSHLLHLGGDGRGFGSGSYPNYGAATKPLDHPDIFTLAFLAEKAGIDLRIIVTLREAGSLLESDVSRGFADKLEGKILIDNAKILYQQLSYLDHRFFMCLDYDFVHYHPAALNEHWRNFLHEGLSDTLWGQMLKKFSYRGGKSPTKGVLKYGRYTLARLRSLIRMTRRLCATQPTSSK